MFIFYKEQGLTLQFVCVYKDTARYVLSNSRHFGLLPKDLVLNRWKPLQSLATSCSNLTDYSNYKY